jgi:hypothetical protein
MGEGTADEGGLTGGDRRREEADAEILRVQAERTFALAAPEPPPSGALTANGSGWLVGAGARILRHPRLIRAAVPVGAWLGVFIPDLIDLVGLPHRVPVMLGGALVWAVTIDQTIRLVSRVLISRHLGRALRPARLAEVPPGTLVAVTGVIPEQATIRTLFRGRPAVLFRHLLAGVRETRGIDFLLDLPWGERVRVSARQAVLLDRPVPAPEPLACGPVSAYRLSLAGRAALEPPPPQGRRFGPFGRFRQRQAFEASVGPGSRVEVVGVVDQQADPDAASSFDRHTPVELVLRAPGDAPLYVRSVTEVSARAGSPRAAG